MRFREADSGFGGIFFDPILDEEIPENAETSRVGGALRAVRSF